MLRSLAIGLSAGALVALGVFLAGQRSGRTDRRVTTALAQQAHSGCLSRRAVIVESNRRIGAHVTERKVLARFLTYAARARAAGGTPIDERAASDYRVLREDLRQVVFRPLPVPVCPTVAQLERGYAPQR